ncbi:hypothetical protein OH77DRAFT_1203821 [Trametes cingulata]|nr:hypothetical protein OH77DRAFT_1203821 [Trametes cingulata]
MAGYETVRLFLPPKSGMNPRTAAPPPLRSSFPCDVWLCFRYSAQSKSSSPSRSLSRMARYCNLCKRSFPTYRGFKTHNARVHKNPRPPRTQRSTFRYHPHLNAQPCTREGDALPPNAPPPPRELHEDWDPFEDRPTFEFASHLFEKMHASEDEINQLLRIHAAKRSIQTQGEDTDSGYFDSAKDMYSTIDSIPYGEAPWATYKVRYTGPADPDAPWKHETYHVHTRDIKQVLMNMAASPEFDGKWDYVPFEEYTGENNRRYSHLMSGRFAWRQADKIAQDPATHGSMLCVAVLGADKTTVSVATGHQEFHPVYVSAGNIHNDMRRAHCEGVTPLAFLPIPKAARRFANTEEFRIFKKQLYHAALRQILEPLRHGMSTPEVIRCPDGHFRRTIFEIGPFIADYPEQVYVSGVVQGWCPKCRAWPEELEKIGALRFRAHTECLYQTFEIGALWDTFGVNGDVRPFTYDYPRADIHELLSPDILHQLIKGTFKDHLVDWVEEYVYLTADSDAKAKEVMDDIDRRIASAPAFPGLRRFPEGRNFSQWTGNDSKVLMKVFLPAIVGYVPEDMVRCIAAFLDFCYLARISSHDTATLCAMDDALSRFHTLCHVFEDVGVRPDGFSLPRQHSLVHYVNSIKLFGSPNGLCSSITESKHIAAVKIPWRESNRHNCIGQIVRSNTRSSKLSAARAEYGRRGMLEDDILTYTLRGLDLDVDSQQAASDARFREELEAVAAPDARRVESSVNFSDKPTYTQRLHSVSAICGLPQLHESIRRFMYDQLNPELDGADAVPLHECPDVPHHIRLGIYHSATAVFYAPSEVSGPGGMHRELIRSNPSWYGQYPRYDTVLVNIDPTRPGMRGMLVARVRLFFSFAYDNQKYPCAFVEWFVPQDDEPDPVTGMWTVVPEMVGDERVTGVIHLDSIVRACHLMPGFGTTPMPYNFHFSHTLDAFRAYYVNRYADYHTYETII